MHISWNFLDKNQATIDAVVAYDSMDFIIRHTDEQIQNIRSNAENLGAVNMDGMPHAHNPHASEDALIDQIDEIDVLKERYRQAVEYMNWFKPAWDKLSEDDRFVLSCFFMDKHSGAAEVIADHFQIERSSAYNKRKRAISRLRTLLYGKS